MGKVLKSKDLILDIYKDILHIYIYIVHILLYN